MIPQHNSLLRISFQSTNNEASIVDWIRQQYDVGFREALRAEIFVRLRKGHRAAEKWSSTSYLARWLQRHLANFAKEHPRLSK